jgi:pre-mRNA-splicing factor CWC26
MRDGAKAGLLEYSDFQLDQQRLRKEKAEAALSADSGALAANPASTVYRDKTGRRMTASEALEKEGVLEARKEAQRLEQTRGQVQKDEIARKVKLAQEIANAPFSRYRDDKTLEKHLKTRTRAEDPMAQYLGLSIDEPTTDGGATVEGSSTPRTSFPAYKGMRPPNRYNIVPGHRWDGIERGNGFESKVMASLLKKKHDRQHDFASRSRNM